MSEGKSPYSVSPTGGDANVILGELKAIEGLIYVWRPGTHAECRVRVVEVLWNGEETWVRGEVLDGKDAGGVFPNELTAFLEAIAVQEPTESANAH